MRSGTRGLGTLLAAGVVTAIAASASATPSASPVPILVIQGVPDSGPFHDPRGVAIDVSRGQIVLANTDDHAIEIFSYQGRRLARFQHRVRSTDGSWQEGLPRGVAVDASGSILVADARASYVDVLDMRGRSVTRIPTPVPDGAGGLAGVAVTSAGRILTAAPGTEGRVYVFGPDLAPLYAWGEPGAGPGKLSGITGIAGLPDGSIAVTCANTELGIQIFTAEGTYLRGWGRHELGPGNVSLPSGITSTLDGHLWVTDELRHHVQVFDSSGTFVSSFGGMGTGPGDFQYPSALASDGASRLVVAERGGGRFQLFRIGAGVDPDPKGGLDGITLVPAHP